MKIANWHIPNDMLDAIADEKDLVDVRVEDSASGLVLYIDINGQTIFRLGHIKFQVEFADNSVGLVPKRQ